MRKIIKQILFIIGIGIITIFLVLNYHNHFSKEAIKGKENITFSKRVAVGMTESEILNIMGQPDTIIKDNYPIYCYSVNNDSYGYGQILFDSTMRVKNIYFPNN